MNKREKECESSHKRGTVEVGEDSSERRRSAAQVGLRSLSGFSAVLKSAAILGVLEHGRTSRRRGELGR